MILDKGFCTIYGAENTAAEDETANNVLDTIKHQSWYGELNFENTAINPTEFRRDVETTQRIRIMQKREIENNDVVVLSNVLPPPAGAMQYEIVRAYHGVDDENGQLITDLNLCKVVHRYEFG